MPRSFSVFIKIFNQHTSNEKQKQSKRLDEESNCNYKVKVNLSQAILLILVIGPIGVLNFDL